ncbi:hypothetical protein D3C81_2164380 [compost metagenome]
MKPCSSTAVQTASTAVTAAAGNSSFRLRMSDTPFVLLKKEAGGFTPGSANLYLIVKLVFRRISFEELPT